MKMTMILLSVILSFTSFAKTESIDSNFHGTWAKCIEDDYGSIKSTQIISSNSLVASNVFYNNTTCDDADRDFASGVTYSVTASSPLTLSLNQATFTPYGTGLASSWNFTSYCELTNWSTGIPNDITDKDCDGITFTYGTSYEMTYSRSGNTLTYEVGDEVGTLELVP